MDKLDKIIQIIHNLKEEGMVSSGPTNSLGSGKIAGTVEAGDNPPVNRKRPPVLARGRMPGARTRWRQGLR